MQRFLISFVLIGALALQIAPATYAQRRDGKSAVTATASASSARNTAEHITAAQLKAYLEFIASDDLEGRDTPSRGLDIAAKYIASNLARWGLKPAGDAGTFFQRYTLRRNNINPSETHAQVGEQRFTFGNDFLARARSTETAAGSLVYVGHGWVIKSKNINAYEGIDVRDKIMIVSGEGLPKGVTQADLGGEMGEDWSAQDYAVKNGAKGIIQIPGYQSIALWDRLRRNAVERGTLVVEKFQARESASITVITPSLGMLTTLFRGEKQGGAELFRRSVAEDPGPAFDLDPKKRMSFAISVTPKQAGTQNVVAVLEGSDPVLKNEYVAIGAHYDHVGVGSAVSGDAIYNGADDDGSGTVATLAMAEAFARGPRPKRSLLFVWHSGEEKGLWGSRYFVEHPTVPLSGIITQLNIDMIGRSRQAGDTKAANKELTGPNEIYVIGSKMMSTELGQLSEAVNKSYLNLAFNYAYDDPKDPNRFFFRSDHFNYAQKGIPIIFYFDGVHEDYHRPSDSVDKIDYQKMERVARTIFMTAWQLANTATRPPVDKQLPAELTRR
ncbi:MAG: M28 family peptidase [Pyrinomonadaceae bacterium]|nr:M28 family peptidase [Pyrinomonadaceae bacterium]